MAPHPSSATLKTLAVATGHAERDCADVLAACDGDVERAIDKLLNMDKFETVDKKQKKKAGEMVTPTTHAPMAKKFEKKQNNGGVEGKFNKENARNGKFENGKFSSTTGPPAPRAGERGERRDRGVVRGAAASAPTQAVAAGAAGVTAAAPVASTTAAAPRMEPAPNPAPIRPGGKTLADLVRGEPAAAPMVAAPKASVPRPQGAGKPAPKVNGAATNGAAEPSYNSAAVASEPVNWAKKVSGAQAPVPQAAEPQAPVQRPPQPTQQPPQQQARQAAPQPSSTDSFGFGFDPSATRVSAPRPQQGAEQAAQAAQDLGLQFGNFSATGGDFGFGFDSTSQQSAAGWGVQQQQQQQQRQQPVNKKQPSRNSGAASKLPDANSFNGATTSGPDGQQAYGQPAAYGAYGAYGAMPNAYANYMMPPAVPMAAGYTGYEGYQQAQSAQSGASQEGAYAEYYKQQAAQQAAMMGAATGGAAASVAGGDKTSGTQQMQSYANMPNAYGHPMYSYPYGMPHQQAYPYAVQSHYAYAPAAGVYPGAAPTAAANGKQATSGPPGYKAAQQDQYSPQQYTQQQYTQQYNGQNGSSQRDNAAQYAEMQQGYYTQYASQYAAGQR
jgi:hypothetical protein